MSPVEVLALSDAEDPLAPLELPLAGAPMVNEPALDDPTLEPAGAAAGAATAGPNSAPPLSVEALRTAAEPQAAAVARVTMLIVLSRISRAFMGHLTRLSCTP
jgi:hypothetical protein